jgi:hypothetical protein
MNLKRTSGTLVVFLRMMMSHVVFLTLHFLAATVIAYNKFCSILSEYISEAYIFLFMSILCTEF